MMCDKSQVPNPHSRVRAPRTAAPVQCQRPERRGGHKQALRELEAQAVALRDHLAVQLDAVFLDGVAAAGALGAVLP